MPKFFRACRAAYRTIFEPGVKAFMHEMGWKTRGQRAAEKRDAALLAELLPPPEYEPEPQDVYTSMRPRSAEHLRALAYLNFRLRNGWDGCKSATAARLLGAHFSRGSAAA